MSGKSKGGLKENKHGHKKIKDTKKVVFGRKVQVMNYSTILRHCNYCSRLLPNFGMIVDNGPNTYCDFNCSERDNANLEV